MGRRGPKAQPSAIKKLGKGRVKNLDEPKFAAGAVSCPAWLTGYAKTEWVRVMRYLSKVDGLIGPVDRSVVASYCQAYARWRDAEIHLVKDTDFIVYAYDKLGQVCGQYPSPWIGISKTYHDAMMKSARELGITPSARMGIKLPQSSAPNLGSQNKQGAADPFKPPTSTPPAKVALCVERKKR